MGERKITVYTTPFCVPFEQLKRYLDTQGVSFATRDLMIDEDAQDKVDDAGIRTTPILEVDGKLYSGEALAPNNIRVLLDL